jgi:hypothetical protein
MKTIAPTRRDFLKIGLTSIGALSIGKTPFGDIEGIIAREFDKLPSPDYHDISQSKIDWKEISKGLYFSRVEIYRKNELVDIIAALKINPEQNMIRVFNGYESPGNFEVNTIEEWQRKTGAIAMVNSAQYMANPAYMPCALVICDGKLKGPRYNKAANGMLVAEPKSHGLPKADLLDFDYNKFDYKSTSYTQGVQHWPILLDREGNIKVKKTLWQANRTVVGKDRESNILMFTTEGGYFTLFNLGRFLKESKFDVHTAMNMDGGYEANMTVKSNSLDYVTYGEFETYGPEKDASIFNFKIKIPGVIGVFPRTS